MPDYEIMRWDEDNFDINSIPWTKQAYEAKKYAFVSDYVRMKALYEYGGIYFDTDVMALKSFDKFLDLKAFTGFEGDVRLTSAIIGAEKNFPLIKEFLQQYDGAEFRWISGKDNEPNVLVMARVCDKYGLRHDNSFQIIKDMHIFPKTYFCPLDFYHNEDFSEDTHTIHYFDASWLDEAERASVNKERSRLHKMINKFKLKVGKLLK